MRWSASITAFLSPPVVHVENPCDIWIGLSGFFLLYLLRDSLIRSQTIFTVCSSVCGRMTANSSPPILVSKSQSRNASLSTFVVRTSRSSPAACPNSSLVAFKSSISAKMMLTGYSLLFSRRVIISSKKVRL